jgi:hypothetical protein
VQPNSGLLTLSDDQEESSKSSIEVRAFKTA